jgi:hypothetical protein
LEKKRKKRKRKEKKKEKEKRKKRKEKRTKKKEKRKTAYFAAQSREDPLPYSRPANTTSAFFSPMYLNKINKNKKLKTK